MTCHRFLILERLGKLEYNSMPKVIIFEECSMLSNEIVAHILRKTMKSKFIFVGDTDQLPPIQWGNFFSETVRSNWVPMIKLTKLHRTDCESILQNIQNVRNKIPTFIEDENSHFYPITVTTGFDKLREVLSEVSPNKKILTKIISPWKKYLPELNKIAREHFLIDQNKIVNDWYLGSVVRITENFYNIPHKGDEIDLMNSEEGVIVGGNDINLFVDFGK